MAVLNRETEGWFASWRIEGNGLAVASGEVPPKAGKTVVPELSMYQVYILKSQVKPRYYIGHTHDLINRLAAHNSGKVRSTKAYRPWGIAYTEPHASKQEAYKREVQIKSYRSGEAFKSLVKEKWVCYFKELRRDGRVV